MSAGEIVAIVGVGITLLGIFAKLISTLNQLSAAINLQSNTNQSIIKTLDNHEQRLILIEHKGGEKR